MFVGTKHAPGGDLLFFLFSLSKQVEAYVRPRLDQITIENLHFLLVSFSSVP